MNNTNGQFSSQFMCLLMSKNSRKHSRFPSKRRIVWRARISALWSGRRPSHKSSAQRSRSSRSTISDWRRWAAFNTSPIPMAPLRVSTIIRATDRTWAILTMPFACAVRWRQRNWREFGGSQPRGFLRKHLLTFVFVSVVCERCHLSSARRHHRPTGSTRIACHMCRRRAAMRTIYRLSRRFVPTRTRCAPANSVAKVWRTARWPCRHRGHLSFSSIAMVIMIQLLRRRKASGLAIRSLRSWLFVLCYIVIILLVRPLVNL